MFRKSYFLLVVLFTLFASALYAQETTPEPISDAIVYIASESRLLESSPSSGHPLIEAINAQPVSTWEQLIEIGESDNIAALVIDESALDEVDWDAVAALYDIGVVIATINVPVEEMAVLINDPTLTDDGFAADPYPGSHFILANHLVLSRFQEYRACAQTPIPNLASPVYSMGSRAQNTLDSDYDLMVFGIVLQDKIDDIAEMRQCFAEDSCGQVPATPPT